MDVDPSDPRLSEFYDELPLWSAPFGLLLLDRVPVQPAKTYLDVGAGTGFVTVELAQRCGSDGSRYFCPTPPIAHSKCSSRDWTRWPINVARSR